MSVRRADPRWKIICMKKYMYVHMYKCYLGSLRKAAASEPSDTGGFFEDIKVI